MDQKPRNKIIVLVGVSLAFIISGAVLGMEDKTIVKGEWPPWLEKHVADSVRVGPISKHIINGETYWYIDNSGICCDQTADVFNEGGKYICSTKGGIVPRGDENCPPPLRGHFK